MLWFKEEDERVLGKRKKKAGVGEENRNWDHREYVLYRAIVLSYDCGSLLIHGKYNELISYACVLDLIFSGAGFSPYAIYDMDYYMD